MARTMTEIVFRIATGTAQRLRAGGVERSFLELGEHGDRGSGLAGSSTMTTSDLRRARTGRTSSSARRPEEGREVRGAGGGRGPPLHRQDRGPRGGGGDRMSLYHLYAAYAIIPAHILRATHLGFVLFLSTCSSRRRALERTASAGTTWCWRCSASRPSAYLLVRLRRVHRAGGRPTRLDLVFGVILLLLVLEACAAPRGSSCRWWWRPSSSTPSPARDPPRRWTHRGYDVERLVGQLYMTLEGIFGTALDVSATFIILFTIYGAVLAYSGAGEFFIDFSLAVTGGKRGGPPDDRALLVPARRPPGAASPPPSPSARWPAPCWRRRATSAERRGRPPRRGGPRRHHLAAGARRGGLPHRRVPEDLVPGRDLDGDHPDRPLLPGALPHGGARRAPVGVRGDVDSVRARASGHAQERASTSPRSSRSSCSWCWGSARSSRCSGPPSSPPPLPFLRRDTALRFRPGRAALHKTDGQALQAGCGGRAGGAATCAAAGIIVGVVTLTGLGLKFSSIVIDLARGNLILTAMFTALVVWVVGLAVPVTASYIICAVSRRRRSRSSACPTSPRTCSSSTTRCSPRCRRRRRSRRSRRRRSPAATPTGRRSSPGSTRCPPSSCRSRSCSIRPGGASSEGRSLGVHPRDRSRR